VSAEKNPVLKPRHIDVVDPEIGPIEHVFNSLECLRLVHFVNFGHVENRLPSVHLLEITNDLQNGRFRAVKMQTRIGK